MIRLNFNKLIPVFVIISLFTSVSAVASVSWGVEVGEIGIYWLEDVRFSGEDTNLAPLLGDTNRTSIVIISDIGTDYLNYTLGLTNGTNNLVDQQILLEELEINDNIYYIPSGDAPFVLPLSVGDYGNYLQTLTSQTAIIEGVVQELISSDQNFSFIEDFSVDPVYTGVFLNISASATLNNETLVSEFFGSQVNITDFEFSSENENVTSTDVVLKAAYNGTNGMLIEVQIDSEINTIAEVNNSTQFNTYTFNTTIIQKDFIALAETISSLSSISSSIAENPYFGLLTIPVLFLLRRKNKD